MPEHPEELVRVDPRPWSPGPWRVDYRPYGDSESGIQGYEPSGDILDRDDVIIRFNQANEHLKAAAPALFSALEDLTDMCVTQGSFKNGVVHNGIDEGEFRAGEIISNALLALMSVHSDYHGP